MPKTSNDPWFANSAAYSSKPEIITLISIYNFEGFGRLIKLNEMLCGEQDNCFRLSGKYLYVLLAESLKWTQEGVKDFLTTLIDLGIYVEKDGKVCCPDLCKSLAGYKSRTEIASKAGVASAAAKKKAKDERERKRNERRETYYANKDLTKLDPVSKQPEPLEMIVVSPAPPKVEKPKVEPENFEGLDETQIQNWVAFKAWITKNDYKQVQGMAKPLSPQQYNSLLLNKKYTPQLIRDTFLAMENTKLIKKKYMSANLTLQRWLQLAIERIK